MCSVAGAETIPATSPKAQIYIRYRPMHPRELVCKARKKEKKKNRSASLCRGVLCWSTQPSLLLPADLNLHFTLPSNKATSAHNLIHTRHQLSPFHHQTPKNAQPLRAHQILPSRSHTTGTSPRIPPALIFQFERMANVVIDRTFDASSHCE